MCILKVAIAVHYGSIPVPKYGIGVVLLWSYQEALLYVLWVNGTCSIAISSS